MCNKKGNTMKKNIFLLFTLALHVTLQCSDATGSDEIGDFIGYPINVSQTPVKRIRIFSQFKDEYLQNNAVVLAYDGDDNLIPDYNCNDFIIYDRDGGHFWTMDQTAQLLKDLNNSDPTSYLKTYRDDNKMNKDANRIVLTRSPLGDPEYSKPASAPNKWVMTHDASSKMRYKGIQFDWMKLIITMKPGEIYSSSTPKTILPIYSLTGDQSINDVSIWSDTCKNEGFDKTRDFYFDYAIQKNLSPFYVRLIRGKNGSNNGQVPPTFNHNDFIIVKPNIWFSVEDIAYKVQNNLCFNVNALNNLGYYAAVNVSKINA
jgi:hypothetical protein